MRCKSHRTPIECEKRYYTTIAPHAWVSGIIEALVFGHWQTEPTSADQWPQMNLIHRDMAMVVHAHPWDCIKIKSQIPRRQFKWLRANINKACVGGSQLELFLSLLHFSIFSSWQVKHCHGRCIKTTIERAAWDWQRGQIAPRDCWIGSWIGRRLVAVESDTCRTSRHTVWRFVESHLAAPLYWSSCIGGHFELSIQVPSNYPIHPPTIKFVTTICHPNIHFKVTTSYTKRLFFGVYPNLIIRCVCADGRDLFGHIKNGLVTSLDSEINCAGHLALADESRAFFTSQLRCCEFTAMQRSTRLRKFDSNVYPALCDQVKSQCFIIIYDSISCKSSQKKRKTNKDYILYLSNL